MTTEKLLLASLRTGRINTTYDQREKRFIGALCYPNMKQRY
jgi:hypothetical protein